jgi:hypothetical protein
MAASMATLAHPPRPVAKAPAGFFGAAEMPRPQLQTVALRTRPSVFVCAESPAPDSLVFVQNNGWEWAPSGRKLGGNDRSTDNLPTRQRPTRVVSVLHQWDSGPSRQVRSMRKTSPMSAGSFLPRAYFKIPNRSLESCATNAWLSFCFLGTTKCAQLSVNRSFGLMVAR